MCDDEEVNGLPSRNDQGGSHKCCLELQIFSCSSVTVSLLEATLATQDLGVGIRDLEQYMVIHSGHLSYSLPDRCLQTVKFLVSCGQCKVLYLKTGKGFKDDDLASLASF